MPDLDQRFRSLDRLDTPDIRADIRHRSRMPEPAIPGPRISTRIVAAVVSLTIVGVAAVLAARELRHQAVDTPPLPAQASWRDFPEGLSPLPDVPIQGQAMAALWGGGRFLIWGGQAGDGKPARDTGALFDAAAGTWTSTAPSPLSPRSWPGAAWTGTEFVIWGGSDDEEEPRSGFLGDGAAYDPETDTWRRLAAAPIPPNAPLTTTWTGSEVVFWGSYGGTSTRTGAAYNPVSDTWRVMPDVPAGFNDAASVWTGHEVVVFGARLGVNNHPETPATGVAYDPIADSWRSLPDSALSPNATDLVWDGERLIAVDYIRDVQTLDEAEGRWVDLPRLPANNCEGYAEAAVDDGVVLVAQCGELVSLAPGAERWHVVLGRGEAGDGFWYATPFAVDGAFLLWGWTPENDRVMHVYKPPSETPDADRARDVAAAFAALRTDFAYGPANVVTAITAELDALLSHDAAAEYENRDVSGLHALWGDYYSFEIVDVQGGQASFTVDVKFTAGPSFKERLTIGPGVGVDGLQHPFVVLQAEPVE